TVWHFPAGYQHLRHSLCTFDRPRASQAWVLGRLAGYRPGMRYPLAEWIPWQPRSPDGRPTFYAGTNRPVAVVLHTMQGFASTAREWATGGHFGQSWHYTVARDGSVYQHLEHHDGGYHAGITADQAMRRPPAWALWRGPAVNVNSYTIGIEHE